MGVAAVSILDEVERDDLVTLLFSFEAEGEDWMLLSQLFVDHSPTDLGAVHAQTRTP